jgi:peptide/nickel transport system permease protein
MVRHILPNALVPVLVSATLGVAGAILTESGLSFLGLGVQPPTPSWGNILIDGKANIEIAWWLSAFPGLAILLTVLAYNRLRQEARQRTWTMNKPKTGRPSRLAAFTGSLSPRTRA